jgi:DNA (cytosine-5)-methyltransferase 1
MMKVGSLFAGIGGFDLGFERADFEVAWSVEWDKNAQNVLRKRFPKTRVLGDIREVDANSLERVDVICGGFPCQDLSVAGKRAGLAGERSGLFHDAMRLVRKLRPEILVLENVPGLLSSNNGLDFATVLREVGKGWDCEEVAWRVLDSQYFGVPQRRRRVFIVGSSRIGRAEQVLALSESCGGDHPKKRATREEASSDTEERARNRGIWWDGGDVSASITTRSHFQSMPDKGNLQAVIEQRTVGALCARDYKGVGSQYVEEGKVVVDSRHPIAIPFRKSKRARSDSDDETWISASQANTLNQFDSGERDTHAIATSHAFYSTDGTHGVNQTPEVSPPLKVGSSIGIPSPPAVAVGFIPKAPANSRSIGAEIEKSPTVTTHHAGQGFFRSMTVRRLTPRECERLQGFPDDWTQIGTHEKPTADSHRYKQLGNAVTVNVAEWLARRIKQSLEGGSR